MKLGEALSRRADLQRRLAQLGARLRASAVVQEGSDPAERPEALLAESDELAGELERLIAAVNKTNSQSRLPDGQTLTEALARRDVLAVRQEVLRSALAGATEAQVRYGRAEIKMIRMLDVAGVRKQADSLARQARELDTLIQQQNWTVDLHED